MLQSLSIRDFVIVAQLDLEFQKGFTVLTGETGAGKSILIDALSLALGSRGDSTLIRENCERAVVSACFTIHQLPDVLDVLAAAEIEHDGTLLLRRVLYRDGRSRAFVNDLSITLVQLKALGECLVDIYSQNSHHSLLNTTAQRSLLDSFIQAQALVTEVSQHYHVWQTLHKHCMEYEQQSAMLQAEFAHLENEVAELGAVALSAEDWLALNQAHQRNSHHQQWLHHVSQSLAYLSEQEPSALQLTRQAQQCLTPLLHWDDSLNEADELLETALTHIQEATRLLNRQAQTAQLAETDLEVLEHKMANIHRVSRKYQIAPDDMLERLATSQVRLNTLSGLLDNQTLQAEERQAWQAYQDSASALTQQRQVGANALQEAVSRLLPELALNHSRFEVALLPQEASASGMETLEFMWASHTELSAKPLRKIASGGELSRVSLALRLVTAQSGVAPTLIFDEVDVGIGGRTAELVGQLLKTLGEQATHQVLVITHLPQVAALGQHHWCVEKQMGDTVLSTIRVLDNPARVAEIARMLGGITLTETTYQHARELLEKATLRNK